MFHSTALSGMLLYYGTITCRWRRRLFSSFITRILEEEEEANVKPIIEEEGISYLYVRHNNLYCKSQSVYVLTLSHFSLVLAVTNRNSNAAMVLLFLHKIVEVDDMRLCLLSYSHTLFA